jgi:ABC-2 type transport system permease protein
MILTVFGVFMPVQAGVMWVKAAYMPLVYAWLPLFLVSALVADSFAGERERHTLETLLTTALSDGAVLLGKVGAAVLYGYGMLLVVMGVGIVTLNTSLHTWRKPLFYRMDIFLAVIVLGFLVTLMIAGFGVVVSLKASTVRQAGQALSLGILGIVWGPVLVIGYGLRLLPPATRETIIEWASLLDGRSVVALLALALGIADAIVLAVAASRFRRARLVFE